jgi:hypothetical protein
LGRREDPITCEGEVGVASMSAAGADLKSFGSRILNLDFGVLG